jgi:hypothetical protein
MPSSIDASRTTPGGRGAALLAIGVALLAAGCTSALPVRQVVVYRNGVAYFERGGYVARPEVRFKMKTSAVSDLLATLAVTEGGGTRAAAGPPVQAVDVEYPESGEGAGDSGALETVVLSLDGHPHDLRIGYIGQSPVWKPSYRLVLHPGGTANLQLWGMVENLSGEDWRAVKLSLIAGAPIAFESDLRTPVIPSHPRVSDRGDPTPPMVRGEASYHALNQALSETTTAETAAPVDPRAAAHRLKVAQMTEAASGPPSTSTGVFVDRGTTRYDVTAPVTIPSEGASMVMVLDRRVAGEMLLLFAPDADVPESATHPFRAARFVNDTGGALEPGPVTIFEDGSFVSQALLEAIPAGASGTMPLGIEDAVVVTLEVSTNERSGALANDGIGGLTIARERVTRSTYRLHNDSAQSVKVFVKHARIDGAQLLAPSGTEQSVGLPTALVPATVPAHASADLVVQERLPARGAVDWFASDADAAVRTYLADPHADPAVAKKLVDVWAIRYDVVKLMDERNGVRMQQYEWIQKNGSARPESAAKIAGFERRLADLDSKISAATAHFNVALHDIVAPAGL